MTQPRKSPSRSKASTARKATARSRSTEPKASANNAGIRLPGDLVLITRERIQELFDDAVERGRMTRDDATELVSELVRRSRRQSTDLVADIEQLLGRSRDQLEDVGRRAKKVAGLTDESGFPVDEYDDLTAAQVQERLGPLTPAELRKVRDYERRNANRKSVLAAIEQRLK